MAEGLREQRQAEVVNIVVGHVDVDQALIYGDRLCDGFRTVVGAFIVGEVQGLQRAILSLEVLRDRLTPFETDLVRIQVKHLQRVVFKQVLHEDVATIVSEQVLSNRQLLKSNVILEHLAEVNRHGLADGFVHGVLDVEFFQGEV